MAKPIIRIDQVGNAVPVGIAGESRTDLDPAGVISFVDTANAGAEGTHEWIVKGATSGFPTALTDGDTDTATLDPGGVRGTIIVEKKFNGQSSGEVVLGRFVSDQGGAAVKLAGGTMLLPRGLTDQFSDGWDVEMEDQARALDVVRGFADGTWTPEGGADAVIAPNGVEAARFQAADGHLLLPEDSVIESDSILGSSVTFKNGNLELAGPQKAMSFVSGLSRCHQDIGPVLANTAGLGRTSAGFNNCYLMKSSVPSTPSVGIGCLYLTDNAGTLELRVIDDDGTEYKATLTAI